MTEIPQYSKILQNKIIVGSLKDAEVEYKMKQNVDETYVAIFI